VPLVVRDHRDHLLRGRDFAAIMWQSLWRGTLTIWAVFLLPLLITVETALLAGIEHGERQWKHMFALPIPRAAIYVAKFGVLQGLLLIVQRFFRLFCQKREGLDNFLKTHLGTGLRVALTFVVFSCTMVIFRSPTVLMGGRMLKHILMGKIGEPCPYPKINLVVAVVAMIVGHALMRERLEIL
jgi:hypothetical protein